MTPRIGGERVEAVARELADAAEAATGSPPSAVAALHTALMMLLVRAFGEGGALEVAQGMIDNAHAALSTARTDPGKRPN